MFLRPTTGWRAALVAAACALTAAVSAKTLHFWAVTGSVLDVALYRNLARDFTRETGIDVEVTPLAWGSFETKYFTAMAAGLPPDVGITNLGGPMQYGQVGGVVDLREAFPREIPQLERQFDPKLLRMFGKGRHLYGIPADLSTLVMYLRTDVFRQLGLATPTTWSELNRTIDTLESKGYRTYFGFTAGAQWALGLYTLPYDLPGIDLVRGKPVVNWTRPAYQRGVMEALRLWNLHDSPGRDLGSRAIGLFRSDEPGTAVPLMLDIHGTFDTIRHDAPEIAGKWTVAPWPKADDGQPFNVVGGTSYVVFRRSNMKAEAMRWIRYLLSDRVQAAIVREKLSRNADLGIALPPTRSMWAASNGLWNEPDLKPEQPLVDVLRRAYPTFQTLPLLPGGVEANRLEANLLDSLATGIQDDLDALARQKGLSRRALLAAIGRGQFSEESQDLEAKIAARLHDGYAKIAPQAQALLDTEAARYESRYGSLIDRLPELERQRSILDNVKAFVSILFLCTAVWILSIARLRRHALSYLFVLAPLALAAVFVFVPALVALYLSFTDYHPVLPLSTAAWTGTKNYSDAIHGGDLGASLARTFRYALLTVAPGIAIALVFAYLLNHRLRGSRFWRFVYFSPLVTSVVSVALIFSQLFMPTGQGWLNRALLSLQLVRDPIPFLTSEHWFPNAVVLLAIWQGLAFSILVFLAGLQQVPEALFEAAEIDGASSTRRFWHVALPGIRPQIFFVTVLGIIGAFQVFETIYTLANKSGDAGARFGPNDSALTMVPLIYHSAFETFEMGKSAAIAYVLFALILGVTLIQLAIYRRSEALS